MTPLSLANRPLTAEQQQVVEANAGLAYQVARKMCRHDNDLPDYQQAALMGLMRAAKGFNPSLGFKFSTYAYRGAINGVRTLQRDLARQTRQLTCCSVGSSDSLTPLDTAPFDRDGPVDALSFVDDASELHRRLGQLESRQRLILSRRFGLTGEPATLAEVGIELGLTKERVRQLQEQGMARLRELMQAA